MLGEVFACMEVKSSITSKYRSCFVQQTPIATFTRKMAQRILLAVIQKLGNNIVPFADILYLSPKKYVTSNGVWYDSVAVGKEKLCTYLATCVKRL